ncbi:L-seryl-tRNA(Sec) selenium transferase [Thalassobacillus hwangdonensis]|uniref:L-seryl-tRNA(Sec) selenium transferase n=1 Tax=Thalassobacillus hwangdonensis TaxID=546108 RepID=A0ABW3KWQ4_9BACI
MHQLLRSIPAIHGMLNDPQFRNVKETYGLSDQVLTSLIQRAADALRQDLIAGIKPVNSSMKSEVLERTNALAKKWGKNQLTRVINGSGTVLHTNLGRARLSERAVEHVTEIASSYSNLEYSIHEGKRGSRHTIAENLIQEITGAEAAMVVNNNAAAVYLILKGLAKGMEVIVSRGELVEIGGSFRVSSIMEESGAQLKEVGTTNKTHLYDYEEAINEHTSMIMKVHTSNFSIRGFTTSQSRKELVPVTDAHELIYYEDLGSGSLIDYQSAGIGDEPTVKQVIEAGADLVSFSGDKLLGGPQAGIIAGKKKWIDKLKKHQLARVLRTDKMTLAALEATLLHYLNLEALDELPVYRDINISASEVKRKAEHFMKRMSHLGTITFTLKACTSRIGGGTMPEVELASFGLHCQLDSYAPHELEKKLRLSEPAVVGRFLEEKFFLDFRTLTDKDIDDLVIIFEALDQRS